MSQWMIDQMRENSEYPSSSCQGLRTLDLIDGFYDGCGYYDLMNYLSDHQE